MLQNEAEATSIVAALLDRAKAGQQGLDPARAAAWQRVETGAQQLERPQRPLLVLTPDGQAPAGMTDVRAALAPASAVTTDPARALGAARILVVLPVGQLLSDADTAGLRRVLRHRPAGSWRVAASGAERLVDEDEIDTQTAILARLTTLLSANAAGPAPLLFGATSESAVGRRLAADAQVVRDWVAKPGDVDAVRAADVAVLVAIVDGLDAEEREASAVLEAAMQHQRERASVDQVGLERLRAEAVARLGRICAELELTIPGLLDQFTLSGVRQKIAQTEAGGDPARAIHAALDALWEEVAGALRARFMERLTPWRQWVVASWAAAAGPALGLDEASPKRAASAPLWQAVPQAPAQNAVPIYLVGGGAGLVLGFAAHALAGAVIVGAAGALAAPLLLSTYGRATGRTSKAVDGALERAAALWRREAQTGLLGLLTELRTETVRQFLAHPTNLMTS